MDSLFTKLKLREMKNLAPGHSNIVNPTFSEGEGWFLTVSVLVFYPFQILPSICVALPF